MSKIIVTGLLAIILGLTQIATINAAPSGQPWDTITLEGQ